MVFSIPESLPWTIILFLVGLVLICIAGDKFVDAAVAIAKRLKIPQIVVGATIVSLGTTLPDGGHGCLKVLLDDINVCTPFLSLAASLYEGRAGSQQGGFVQSVEHLFELFQLVLVAAVVLLANGLQALYDLLLRLIDGCGFLGRCCRSLNRILCGCF